MPLPNDSTAQRRFAQKAEQILEGATRVFLERGYGGASMDRIAKTSGVSKQTLYSHFADKEDLFTALVERMSRRRLQDAFGSTPVEGNPKAVLRDLARYTLRQLSADEEYHDFVRLMIGESKRFPELAETFMRNVTRPSMMKLKEYLVNSPLEIDNPEATAHVLLGTVVFFMLSQEIMPGKTVMPIDSDQLADTLVAML
ncbi:MAG: TetR/AcrR family transcriptional regulator [Cyanobacteria bacterium P01_D01_bin.36]